jgi:hypothetical protein
LGEAGVPCVVGDTVEYIYRDAAHTNPLRRVMPVELIEGKGEKYDKAKYRDMLLEVAETVLGFDRTLYGDVSRKNRKWWHQLREQRQKDIDTEYSILQPIL